MLLPLLLAAAPAGPTAAERLRTCAADAAADPAAAERSAQAWRQAGGGYNAARCLGMALANQQRWTAAATAFEDAARGAEQAGDDHAAAAWAQAGNAWLAGGDPAKARTALNTALLSNQLEGLERGEALLDRARAWVAAGDLPAARGDLDQALAGAAADPLAWLLSATLARRMGDLTRAQADIIQALQRAPDDATVQLERGNIAAARGDAGEARAGWEQAVKVQPTSPAAASATAALAQFGVTPAPPPAPAGR